tara:strand:+ start:247 stop:570 length:324 start_codon:yes stop_codon:yes gene_type:complete
MANRIKEWRISVKVLYIGIKIRIVNIFEEVFLCHGVVYKGIIKERIEFGTINICKDRIKLGNKIGATYRTSFVAMITNIMCKPFVNTFIVKRMKTRSSIRVKRVYFF